MIEYFVKPLTALCDTQKVRLRFNVGLHIETHTKHVFSATNFETRYQNNLFKHRTIIFNA
jgi:hypothetical protein